MKKKVLEGGGVGGQLKEKLKSAKVKGYKQFKALATGKFWEKLAIEKLNSMKFTQMEKTAIKDLLKKKIRTRIDRDISIYMTKTLAPSAPVRRMAEWLDGEIKFFRDAVDKIEGDIKMKKMGVFA